MKTQSVALTLTFLLCFSFGCGKQGDRADAKNAIAADDVLTKIEDGIEVVYNPKEPSPPAGSPNQIIVKQDLCIGDEDGIEDFVFSQIRNVQVDEEENIYVADSKEVCVKVFDKEGKHIRTFGKKGQGPREIQMIMRMQVFAGKEILIYDPANRRISFFSLDGTFLRSIPVKIYNFQRTIPDSKGNIVTHGGTPGDNSIVHEIIKFDMLLNPLFTIKTIEVEMIPNVLPMVTPNFVVRLMTNDNIVWGFSRDFKYEVIFVDPEGTTIRKVVKEYDPVKITGEDQERIKKQRFGDQAIPPQFKLEFPKSEYPYYYFVCGDDGSLYVRTFERNDEGDFRYDVFNPEGRYVTKFYLPDIDLVCLVRKDKLYSMVWEDEQGIPVVRRYGIDWK